MTEEHRERQLLGEFLRARRAQVTPPAAGLRNDGQSRRVPGLRRDEVAQLASISPQYYTGLEQGKLPAPSSAVLGALARALRLDVDQERYLRDLADCSRGQQPLTGTSNGVAARVLSLLDVLAPVPALVVTQHMDVVAWTPVAAVFFTDFAALPAAERNGVRLIYLNTEVRSRFTDWRSAARNAAAVLRLNAARCPDDSRLNELVDELSRLDEDFRGYWAEQGVTSVSRGQRLYVHPLAGEFELEWQTLTSGADPNHIIIVLTPPHRSAQEALARLAGAARPAESL